MDFKDNGWVYCKRKSNNIEHFKLGKKYRLHVKKHDYSLGDTYVGCC